MKFFCAVAILAFVFGCLTACADARQAQTSGANSSSAIRKIDLNSAEMIAARRVYGQSCARCHGETGAGGVLQIKDFSLKVPSFQDSRVISDTDDDYRRRIANGGDGMPKFKDKLSENEIANLVAYIRAEFQSK